MKINELLEAVVIPGGEADKIRREFRALLDDAGVTVDFLQVKHNHTNESDSIYIFTIVIPKIKNGEYDADEAEITLRLAHRLISKWLDQKEANGQRVDVGQLSKVGNGRKFSTQINRIQTGSEVIDVPGFTVVVSIADKADTGAANY
jgi:hypothetical protein